jgi:hypothetical protein
MTGAAKARGESVSMEAMEVLLQPDVGVNGLGDIVSKPPFTAYRLSQPHAAKSSCGATPLAHQVQLRVAEEKARSSAFPQLALSPVCTNQISLLSCHSIFRVRTRRKRSVMC